MQGIPGNADLVVVSGAEEDVVGGGVPLEQPHAPAVPVQLQHRLRHVPLQPALRNLPDPHLEWGLERPKSLPGNPVLSRNSRISLAGGGPSQIDNESLGSLWEKSSWNLPRPAPGMGFGASQIFQLAGKVALKSIRDFPRISLLSSVISMRAPSAAPHRN